MIKCPYRKKITITHKNGDEITTEEWLDCYHSDCLAYMPNKQECKRILNEKFSTEARNK